MSIKITYYDPRRKQTRFEYFEEDWRADAFVHKLRAEKKIVRAVDKKAVKEEPKPNDPEPAA